MLSLVVLPIYNTNIIRERVDSPEGDGDEVL